MLIWGIILLSLAILSGLLCFVTDDNNKVSVLYVVFALSLPIGMAFVAEGCSDKTPQFDMQGCVQNCNTLPCSNCLDYVKEKCFTCCAKQSLNYLNNPIPLVCKETVWPYLNDAAKEEIQKKQPEKELSQEETDYCKWFVVTPNSILNMDRASIETTCFKDTQRQREIAFLKNVKICQGLGLELAPEIMFNHDNDNNLIINATCVKKQPEKEECNCNQ